jgi:hypothetical protein
LSHYYSAANDIRVTQATLYRVQQFTHFVYKNHKIHTFFNQKSSCRKNQEMGGERRLGGRLKKAVRKLKLLLSFNIRRWCLGGPNIGSFSYRRRLSFDDRLGLRGCIEDDKSDGGDRSARSIQRATSFASDDDIDKRAEIFIANFRRRLRFERQVSLELSYSRSRGSSFKGGL